MPPSLLQIKVVPSIVSVITLNILIVLVIGHNRYRMLFELIQDSIQIPFVISYSHRKVNEKSRKHYNRLIITPTKIIPKHINIKSPNDCGSFIICNLNFRIC